MKLRRILLIVLVLAVAGSIAVMVIFPNLVRAKTTSGNACISNLRNMEAAIQQWVFENTKQPGDVITMQTITPYLKPKIICPEGGNYRVGPAVSNSVSCSFPTHTLPK